MISIVKLHEKFDRLMDEVQTDYFQPTEKDNFFNDAQGVLFKKLMNPDGHSGNLPGVNSYYESSMKIPLALGGLSRKVESTMNMAGRLEKGELEALVSGSVYKASGLKVLCPDTKEYVSVRWITNSEEAKQGNMHFFKPTCCEPAMTIAFDNFYIIPEDIQYQYKTTVVIWPPDVSLANTIDSQFDISVMDRLVFEAASLAALSIRDEELRSTLQQSLAQGV